jgi:UDP-3-O-[3-hydroxymyristoyl] glucosamine N-acyltransferase
VGGKAGLPGHIRIGAGATIAAQAGVFGDVPAGATLSGYPARPHKESLRAQASLFRMPQLMKRLRALERAVFGQEPPDS